MVLQSTTHFLDEKLVGAADARHAGHGRLWGTLIAGLKSAELQPPAA